jgi:hypothetical protein
VSEHLIYGKFKELNVLGIVVAIYLLMIGGEPAGLAMPPGP